MNESIKAGDVVKLKSSGPRMTVQSVEGDMADCAWFPSDIDIKVATIAVAALVIARMPEGQ